MNCPKCNESVKFDAGDSYLGVSPALYCGECMIWATCIIGGWTDGVNQ
tara:strand:- start:765 stop:908 length:144 start_codon:yes stop_codon:yes gene_type:complete